MARGVPLTGRVVAVTGAGAGIGRALALDLARRHAIVALADIDGVALAETESLVVAAGGTASGAVVDVTDQAALERWAARVDAHYGRTDVVICNAGMIIPSTPVDELDPGQLRRIVEVNQLGPVFTTLAFLPSIRRARRGAVVVVSSVAAEVGFGWQLGYSMSKFGARGFTEGLRMELLDTAVHVMSVLPGLITGTQIALNAPGYTAPQAAAAHERLQRFPLATDASLTAEKILRGLERGRARVLIGKDAVVMDLLVRAAPAGYIRLFAGAARRYADVASS